MTDIYQDKRRVLASSARLFPVAALRIAICVTVSLLAGCAVDRPLRTPNVSAAVRAELAPAIIPTPGAVLAPPISGVPSAPSLPVIPEPRLDLLVHNAQAREVFLALVAATRYSMLMHPDVAGTLSVTLRGVTVIEA